MADAVQDREHALEASESRYRSLFDTSPLPTLTWRLRDGRVEQCNQAAREFFGAARIDHGDLRILDVIADDQQSAFSSLPLPADEQTMHAGRWQLRDATDSVRDVELFVSRLEEGSETHVVGVILDITEQQRAQGRAGSVA